MKFKKNVKSDNQCSCYCGPSEKGFSWLPILPKLVPNQPSITSMGDLGGFEPKLDLGQVGDASELLMPFLPLNRRIFYPPATPPTSSLPCTPQELRWQCHNLKWMNAAVNSNFKPSRRNDLLEISHHRVENKCDDIPGTLAEIGGICESTECHPQQLKDGILSLTLVIVNFIYMFSNH